MPILGTIASSTRQGLVSGSWESIATVTGNGSATELNINSIPSTYKHLQIRYFVRNNRAGTIVDTFQVYFNGDRNNVSPTDHYTRNAIRATGGGTTVAYTVVGGNEEGIGLGLIPAVNVSTSDFGVGVTTIYDYANTSKFKSTIGISGFDYNGSYGYWEELSGTWYNTAAVSSMIFFNNGTSAFGAGTVIGLYGLKDA